MPLKAKAKELEGELGAEYPTFVKTMSQRYITQSWMVLMGGLVKRQLLPPHLCREHLPDPGKGREVVMLVDEKDDEFDVQYFKGIKGCYYYINRWTFFARDQKLADGDCIVFQLIEQRKFKVYIRFLLENDELRASNILLEQFQKNEEPMQMKAPQILRSFCPSGSSIGSVQDSS